MAHRATELLLVLAKSFARKAASSQLFCWILRPGQQPDYRQFLDSQQIAYIEDDPPAGWAPQRQAELPASGAD